MLTDEDVKVLISFVPKTDREKLAHCLVAFTLGLGMPSTQVRKLFVDDVVLDGGYVKLRYKWPAQLRLMPMPGWVRQAFLWYADTAPLSLVPDPYFIRWQYQEDALQDVVEKHTRRLLGRLVSTLDLRLAHKANASTGRE